MAPDACARWACVCVNGHPDRDCFFETERARTPALHCLVSECSWSPPPLAPSPKKHTPMQRALASRPALLPRPASRRAGGRLGECGGVVVGGAGRRVRVRVRGHREKPPPAPANSLVEALWLGRRVAPAHATATREREGAKWPCTHMRVCVCARRRGRGPSPPSPFSLPLASQRKKRRRISRSPLGEGCPPRAIASFCACECCLCSAVPHANVAADARAASCTAGVSRTLFPSRSPETHGRHPRPVSPLSPRSLSHRPPLSPPCSRHRHHRP